MALLTPWPRDAAARTLVAYGIELAEIEPLAGGSVNSNFRLLTRDGRVLFARLYEEQGVEGARRETELLRQLAAAGVPTPAPLRSRSGEIPVHAGKPVAVFPWIEGGMRCQRAVTPDDCRRVGAALARVHLAPVSSVPPGRFGPDALAERLDRIDREAAPELRESARSLRGQLRDHAARRDPELPSGLIHGDLFRDNVLWQDEGIAALLDFESASLGPYVYDLCVCVHAWCHGDRFQPELVSALLGGYHAVRPLSEREIVAAPIEAALGALRFAITRITDYSMRAPPGAPPLRDYRRFLARLAAVEAGALAGPLAGLR